jgi:two-component system NtrC family sensor kinase
VLEVALSAPYLRCNMTQPSARRSDGEALSLSVSTHPGIRLLAELTTVLSGSVLSEGTLVRVVDTLGRGLAARRCRLWVRDVEGGSFRAITAPGDEPEPGEAERVRERFDAPSTEEAWDVLELRVPVVYEGVALGLLEVHVAREGRERMVGDVLAVAANILSPLLASQERSQDLAVEVKRRSREIDSQRRFTAKVIDSLPVGLYVIDRDFRIQAWNRKRETGTQGVPRDEALGRPIFEVLSRQPRELLRREFDEVFESGRLQVIEQETSFSGDARHYRITKIPMRLDDDTVTHIITIGEDITEWRDALRRIAQSEKLAAIGQLAAGVMHEINNPLATIGACADAVRGRAEDAGPQVAEGIEEYLRIVDTEVQRCKRIVEGLLDYSRPKKAALAPVALNAVVEETLFLLKHHDRFKRLELLRELADGLPEVEANGEQLIQVFMALMLNAMDAMETRGTLTVRTGRNPGRADEILVAFSDTGSGIPRADIQKIFEPFYTTKPQGRGTGLGLSICYAIVAEHGGRIEVESQLGHGSTFTVFLPTGARPGR